MPAQLASALIALWHPPATVAQEELAPAPPNTDLALGSAGVAAVRLARAWQRKQRCCACPAKETVAVRWRACLRFAP